MQKMVFRTLNYKNIQHEDVVIEIIPPTGQTPELVEFSQGDDNDACCFCFRIPLSELTNAIDYLKKLG